MSKSYDELAARAERSAIRVKQGTTRRGREAASEAQRLLLHATGATSPEELTHIVLGRPTVGRKSGPSPVIRARVPQALKDRVAAIAELEDRPKSAIVRDALATYLDVRSAG